MSPRPSLLLALLLLTPPTAHATAPPPTRAQVVVDSLHGIPVEDPYRWLEDKDAPETRDWVRAQMAHTQEQLARVGGRADVEAVLAKYTRTDTRSVPVVRGARLFLTARAADRQQPSIVMRERHDGPDVMLVDADALSADHTTSVTLLAVSRDGKRMAYGIRKGGEDEVELRLFDVDARRDLPGTLPKGRYTSVAFDRDGRALWYSRWSSEGPRLRWHRIGDDPAKDRVVFGDGLTPGMLLNARVSENGRWLLVTVSVGSSGDDQRLYLRNLERNGPFVTVADTLRASLRADLAGDRLVIETNWQAPNRRVLVADATKPQPENWRTVVPESPDAVVQSVTLAGGRLYVTVLQNVVSRMRVYSLDGSGGSDLPLPDMGTLSAMSGEWAGTDGYFQFSSFIQPPTLYRYTFHTGAAETWWRSAARFPSDVFEIRQFSIRSTHGAKVPFFVVARKGMPFDGSNRVLMGGYGGFNVSVTSQFTPFVASWLELGGVYVSTNLRGGSEFGEAWHRGGMLENKQRTFDDFLNVTQWVLTRGICLRKNLAINGGSNGGLLVGAALTQRPDLYGAVLCQVPLLDMLRYHRFLVARFWVPEYGSSEDREQFNWLRAYSPYQNVRAGVKYPAVMFVTGDADTRVDPLHARKMAARMQALGGENPVLLHYDVNAGHAGGKSVDKSIADNADLLQFLRWRLGMAPVTP
ncbi:MAG: prolyl oligopeptidase family serine peptidase [bacterium]